MAYLKNIIFRILLIFSGVFVFFNANAQLPTYVIDQSFNSEELFQSAGAITDFHFLEDGRVLVGGGFYNDNVIGFGRIYNSGGQDNTWGTPFETQVSEIIPQVDGYVYPSIYGFNKVLLDGTSWSSANQEFWSDYYVGGTFNPYNVERAWDIYQQENGALLIGGAIANDTLQPFVFRGIARIHADGSHDSSFPVLNITPNNAGGAVREIYPAPDGGWYISGGFTAINGHETNHVARLTEDFEVDTAFISPFMYDGPALNNEDILLVDSQSRVWVGGYDMHLQESPSESLQIIRLMPNGEVDATFLPRKLENNYPVDWQYSSSYPYFAQEVIAHPGNYFIYGSFSHFNDTLQPCITVVNDAGIIQNNFFQGQGATINDVNVPRMPQIHVVDQHENGELLIGGAFSDFMGETRYSLVRLMPDIIDSDGTELSQNAFKIYPNPSSEYLNVSFEGLQSGTIRIMNLSGQNLETYQMKGETLRLDVSVLAKGLYFISLETEMGTAVKKVVVN